jgi:glyoxylase-like metal-dependent hydrolase (beta-lactamase superfamily II)
MTGKMLIAASTGIALTVLANSVQAQSATAIVDQAAKAMAGMNALRAIRNEVIESEGKQFDSASTARPLGPTRQIDVHPLPHAEDMVVIYLPAEKIIIEADHISPRKGEVRAAAAVGEFVPALDR